MTANIHLIICKKLCKLDEGIDQIDFWVGKNRPLLSAKGVYCILCVFPTIVLHVVRFTVWPDNSSLQLMLLKRSNFESSLLYFTLFSCPFLFFPIPASLSIPVMIDITLFWVNSNKKYIIIVAFTTIFGGKVAHWIMIIKTTKIVVAIMMKCINLNHNMYK